MGKSSRAIKKKKTSNETPVTESVRFSNEANRSNRKEWLKDTKSEQPIKSNTRILKWGAITTLFVIVLLLSGVFSPGPPSNDFINNEDLPENTFTQEGGIKLSVVLYSSPTCGCCHEYVAYLNENGFDTYQKRTQAYQDIKMEKGIPEEQWSCHTAIIGDYFIEGHIPLGVVYDLLSESPDIDGISLPNMPSGSPGMEGDKNADWVISSISNGQVVNVFTTV